MAAPATCDVMVVRHVCALHPVPDQSSTFVEAKYVKQSLNVGPVPSDLAILAKKRAANTSKANQAVAAYSIRKMTRQSAHSRNQIGTGFVDCSSLSVGS